MAENQENQENQAIETPNVQNIEPPPEVDYTKEDTPFYKTTYGIIAISLVVLIILVLVLKYSGVFNIAELF